MIRTQTRTSIVVNVYDLEPQVNEFLYNVGLGFYHSGVEILGKEYTFAQDQGIIDHPPRSVPNPFRGLLKLGEFDGGPDRLKQALRTLENRFTSSNYEITSNNCNHFANALVHELTGQHLPPYLNRMAHLGSCIHCLLPRSTDALGSENNMASFQAFQGSGHALTSSASPQSSTIMTRGLPADTTADSLSADRRREAVRAATLRRFADTTTSTATTTTSSSA